jgi:hypothetical protein
MKPLGICRSSCKNNIEFEFKEIRFESVDWVYLAVKRC